MISNYNLKLAKLALIQESMKGFPQGIPAIAMPYIIENDIDPSSYLPTQSQEEEPDADTGEARYGGNMISQFDTKQKGGAKKSYIPSLEILETKERNLLKQFGQYNESGEKIPKYLLDQYTNNNKLINENYGKTYAERDKFRKSKPKLNIAEESEWVSGSGDRFDEEGNLKQEHGYFDLKSIEDYAEKVGKRWSGDMYEFAPPPKSGKGVVENPSKKKLNQFVAKLNPANSEGVIDYAANMLNAPLYGVNNLLTGEWESTGNIYTDVAADPTTWFGAKAYTAPVQYAKQIGQAALKYGPEVGKFLQKYGTKGYELVQKYGEAGIDAINKYGKKGIDYVIENAPKIAEKMPPGFVVNIGTRSLQGYGQEQKKDKEIKNLQLQNKILREEAEKAIQHPNALNSKKVNKITPKTKVTTKNVVTNIRKTPVAKPVVENVKIIKKPAAKAVTDVEEVKTSSSRKPLHNWD